jgi:hypothetical protein
MADQTASDVFVERLIDWGVDTIFGLPGDGINGFMDALRTRGDRIRYVRHEEVAAMAAVARGIRIEDPRQAMQQLAEALSWDGPVIIECVVDEHEPPYPAKAKQDQAKKLVTALREGTPNRRRIALQMVKDLLDESSFDASPAHSVPGALGRAAAKAAGKLKGGDAD